MSTFGERLRDAMFAAGMSTAGHVERACKGVVTRHTVRNWLKMEEADVSAAVLGRVAKCLGVRMGYLVNGELPMQRPTLELLRARLVLSRLSIKEAKAWLKEGERMAGD